MLVLSEPSADLGAGMIGAANERPRLQLCTLAKRQIPGHSIGEFVVRKGRLVAIKSSHCQFSRCLLFRPSRHSPMIAPVTISYLVYLL